MATAVTSGSQSAVLTIKSLPGLTDEHKALLKENKITTIAKLRNSELFAKMPAITKAYVLYPPENLEPKLAKKAARLIITTIQKANPTAQTEIVGSIARCNKMFEAEKDESCQEVGDIDILTTASLTTAAKALRESKTVEVLSIYTSGTKITSMICRITPAADTQYTVKVDLFHTKDPETFPFAYLHYTKGKERNIALRNKAKAAGLKLNQDSLIDIKTKEKHKFDDPKKIEAFIKNLKTQK